MMIFDYIIVAQSTKIQAQQRIEANNFANSLTSKVNRDLNAILSMSAGLSSYITVYSQNLDAEKLKAMLADLYARSKHVRNFSVAVNTRITYVYPLESNKQIIGLDYKNISQQWPQVKQAIDTREGVLAGPLDLIQGGRGLIYRYPVYIDKQYWGLLSTVIDIPSFLKSAFSDVTNDYQFAIRVKDTSGHISKAFYGDNHLFSNTKAYRTISEVQNAEWEWAMLESSEPESLIPLLTQALAIGFSLLLAFLVFIFVKERSTLAAHAMYDSLTGLANRRLLYDRIDQSLAQGKRLNRYFGLMYIDIDHFKKINDTYGHNFGDELLKTVALTLQGCIRDVDTLSRIGGDEFIILIEQLADKKDVELVAKKIFSSFEKPISILGKDTLISLSVGISLYSPAVPSSVKILMNEADIALYDVKASGRNHYKIFTQGIFTQD